MPNKLFAVDVETTGLDPVTSSIVAIGAVDIENPSQTFYVECKPWEGADIQDGALRVNGFTRDYLSQIPITEENALASFFNWLRSYGATPIMVAHNSAFDSGFIKEAANRAKLVNMFGFRTIDIHSIVYMHLMHDHIAKIPTRLSLNECLNQFDLPPEPDPHNALTGAKCNAEIFNRITAYKY